MRIDESELPPGWDEGLSVERAPDGAIRRVVATRATDTTVLEADDERVSIVETRVRRWDDAYRIDDDGDTAPNPAVLQRIVRETLVHLGGPRAQALACSFCGKGEAEVRKLIAGPAVYICDECITLCSEILAVDG